MPQAMQTNNNGPLNVLGDNKVSTLQERNTSVLLFITEMGF
jgi:hypothetical protein